MLWCLSSVQKLINKLTKDFFLLGKKVSLVAVITLTGKSEGTQCGLTRDRDRGVRADHKHFSNPQSIHHTHLLLDLPPSFTSA